MSGGKRPGEHPYRDHPRLARIYDSIVQRCYNPNRPNYQRYGGRGITMCDEWRAGSAAFIRWALANGYAPELQLDRIDNSGPYSPENCRWVTPRQNSLNTRANRHLTLLGITKTVTEWCDELPISRFTVYNWLSRYGQEEAERRVYERLARPA